MDLLLLIILFLRIAALLFFTWYIVEKCFTAYDARRLKDRRRYEFQKACKASTVYGDEMDCIITREDDV